MKYICQFPFCDYETNNKQLINFHHIIPKELNGKNKKNNIICLCPNHHNYIYIPNSKHGIHSINSIEKIQIINILMSTNGIILHYKDYNNKEYFYDYINKCLI